MFKPFNFTNTRNIHQPFEEGSTNERSHNFWFSNFSSGDLTSENPPTTFHIEDPLEAAEEITHKT